MIMQYDIDKIQTELTVLRNKYDLISQSYHQMQGAIMMLEQMLVKLQTQEKEDAATKKYEAELYLMY